MTDKRKILWHSNSPLAPTGYGTQTATFVPRLAEKYEIQISAFYGLEGAPIIWNDIPVLPGLGGEFGNQYLPAHAKSFFDDDMRDGLVLTLMDVWVLDPEMISQMNVCSWVPVDHDPAPPAVQRFFLESGSIPIAMSRFGQENLERFDPLYVPHGIDVDAYKPYPKDEVRDHFGLPEDAFIVGMVAANQGRSPSRKGFQQAFEAFRYFREKHENAYLYLHTGMDLRWWQNGEKLGVMLTSLEIPQEAVLIANQYRLQFAPPGRRMMAELFSAFDVLLNPAMGEGFGLPCLEAQACGVPVIASDFSAMKEVVQAGWKVKCRPWWTGQESWQALADVGEIVGALEECESMSNKDRKYLAKKARNHALNYAADKVLTEHLLPALEEVEERIWKPKAPSVPAKVVSA